ncbi:putative F-box/LRR-repeat protein [Arabidopsis thaliana]|uniref:Putative F-box/LRR-repeat protein At3g58920 n=5 Tax=Arabidopsis TaxID=3701 RepID=FBL58_ARATH|nr:F-box/RNI-like superfamily protein [Arabidopsis thaliana]Q9LXR0.1 RecName: Full=Putative F-box/LRR-repeat protein At3g58920 [Arabidopsis thaliana]KAG7629023.1 Leucine-rich repeat 2 [Arabidopsis thaliana x Arabidopsis arenosa]KAG7634939.1 Leucine-rich repeat 2 [Arabidopsis suecica]AEE79850.1 F-box/RNI-like superfamily protein [Arabidopsis thaliana]OAP06012.1 hypothetical protein AXX17_AT3G53450 [Arabidopsis thaliana]CAB88309.1 putative protein [Arabidopsis thaliana]|eukprot:NP_191451.1 F-box/RNI-like superfamily protein [Arabidopsis thaliana]
MDRISNLPNEIICHIVSFLSAKEAAFASVLSKRWQNLFTIVQKLEFDDSVKNQGSLMDFVNGVLALPVTTRISKFSLRFDSFLKRKLETGLVIGPHVVNRCLCNVLKRGVLDLKLEIYGEDGYLLPSEVFTCKTIVDLKLTSCIFAESYVIDVIPENAFLPGLESLFLKSIWFSDLRGCAFQTLLSACPVLKTLTIYDVQWEKWKWSRTVSSATLERLIIQRTEFTYFNGSDFKSITFDTPSLTYLKYIDFVPEEYPVVNLDSIVEAKLHLILTGNQDYPVRYLGREDDPITSNPTNLIKGLRNVEILHLSTATAQMLCFFPRETLPEFVNLHHLTIGPTYYECFNWRLLPILLKKTPNLKTLMIKGPLHLYYRDFNDDEEEEEPEYYCECSSGCNCLLSCHMEVLEISHYRGTTKELEKLKHFLGKLSCLEHVKLGVWASSDKEKLSITTDLLMLPRASVNCKIQINFS